MNVEPNIIVYHCNDKDRCDKFLKKDNYMIKSEEDGIWLGDGMYFWDNLSNANYWFREKKRKDKENKEFKIIKGNANISKILDLTDFDICNTFEEIWRDYCKVLGEDKNAPLGKKINFLFNNVDIINNQYDIIKIHGKYNSTPENNLYKYNIHTRNTQPTLSIKTIYSVRKRNCLFNFEYYIDK